MSMTEKIINRTRFVFIAFFLMAGVSAFTSGSVPIVYQSIFASTGTYIVLALVNLFLIRLDKVTPPVIYLSVTIEVILIFVVKWAFHFDPFNGYGMTLKEPATFLVYFLFAVNCGLRYNKKLNIYFGTLCIFSYILLLLLGLVEGQMYFSSDPARTMSDPRALKVSHEASKLLFLVVFTYFMYLMADFTNRNIKKTEDARNEAAQSLSLARGLLTEVKKASVDLQTGSEELESSTSGIGKIIDENNRLIGEITRITRSFSKAIGDFRQKISVQNESIEQNFNKIRQISDSMEVIHKDSTTQRTLMDEVLKLAEINDRNIKQSSVAISDMQEKSRKIEEITRTINDIADKTNLLSLNAAIESARAGEYGKGFAVVSDEISKLASISMDSSKEISVIIKETVANIDEVFRASQEMSSGLSSIIGFVKRNAEFIQELSSRTDASYGESRLLYSSNEEIDKTTKDLIEHFGSQTELVLQILEWTEKMTSMSEQISENLNNLMILSHRLEGRSLEMGGMLQEI